MTHIDYEEAICDNPGTLCFPQAESNCGWISPILLRDCWFALRAHVPATGHFPPGNILHMSILSPWDKDSVHEWICKPISTCVCYGGWEECVWLTLLSQGAEGTGQLLAPCISCVWWSRKGSKATFGNTSPWDHRVTPRGYLVHSLEKTSCV